MDSTYWADETPCPRWGRPYREAVRVEIDPRHVFLSAQEVIARYRWGQRRGYQNLKDRELVPEPVMRNPDRWRLDQLLAHEDRRIALGEKEMQRATASSHEVSAGPEYGLSAHERLAALLPPPKQQRRHSA